LVLIAIASANFCHCLVPVEERSNAGVLSLTVSLSQSKFESKFWMNRLRKTLIAAFFETSFTYGIKFEVSSVSTWRRTLSSRIFFVGVHIKKTGVFVGSFEKKP